MDRPHRSLHATRSRVDIHRRYQWYQPWSAGTAWPNGWIMLQYLKMASIRIYHAKKRTRVTRIINQINQSSCMMVYGRAMLIHKWIHSNLARFVVLGVRVMSKPLPNHNLQTSGPSRNG